MTAVGAVRDTDGDFMIGDGQMGPVTARLRKALLDVQHGRTAAPDGWRFAVPLDRLP